LFTQWTRNPPSRETQAWSLATYEWSRFPGLHVSVRADGIDPTQLAPLVEAFDARAATYVTGR
jgi:hypothetical protein